MTAKDREAMDERARCYVQAAGRLPYWPHQRMLDSIVECVTTFAAREVDRERRPRRMMRLCAAERRGRGE